MAREINTGVLPHNAKLPSEGAIAARFGVHRHTARRALSTLAEKGAVRIRRGLGTFVQTPVLTYPIADRTRFTATLRQQNREASHELIEAFDGPAPEDAAEALRLALDAPVTVLRTVGLADGVPVSIGTTYLPRQRLPGVAELYRELRSLTAVLERYGLADYRRAMTRVTAGLPTEEEASRLRQSRREPVLMVDSTDVDAAGIPISFSKVRFASGRVQLLIANEPTTAR